MSIKQLGIVNVTSGFIIVSDPCYDESANYKKLPAVNGNWNAKVSIGKEGRIVSLTLENKSVKPDPGYETLTYLGVDSGQMSAFDSAAYRNDAMAEGMSQPDWMTPKRLRTEPKGEKFYGACCNLTYKESEDINAGNFKEVGVVCQSGWGDGSYPLHVWKKDGKVVRLRVRF